MPRVRAFEAKTHLAGLPGAVLRGERLSHEEIVEGMRALRKRVKPGKMTVRELIEKGRRF